MNFIEFNELINEGLSKLRYKSQWTSNSGDNPYKADNLNLLRQILTKIQHVPFINREIISLQNSWLFSINSDTVMVSSQNNNLVENEIYNIKTKLQVLKDINENSGFINKDDLLYIKLPELTSFDDLAKYSNDLKKSIEIPILDESINGNLKIIGADQGSVIIYAILGSIAAVQLVAGICWAAVLIKKKNAEARIFEAHAKTLELKNESLENMIDAQKQQLKNILEAEAEAIASKFYNHNDQETIERLKLSITTVADLVERGAKILPMNNNDEIQKSFPNYNAASLIESTIRQLKAE